MKDNDNEQKKANEKPHQHLDIPYHMEEQSTGVRTDFSAVQVETKYYRAKIDVCYFVRFDLLLQFDPSNPKLI